ncbi:hypothetical protein BGX30_015016 [Mortierella sp. GBA39]|nr:hypothetical protein BGX30_015016 [Mortierella sp. GBA39]
MGAAVSRDHAKLPFGYTHARKDHSFNASSVSRRKLATRLLRTSDTTSVTPFPIQDTPTTALLTNVPSTLLETTAIVSYSNSSSLSPLLVLPPATLSALSSSSHTDWTTTPTSNPIGASSSGTGTSTNNTASTFFVPESGTEASAIPGLGESDHSQHSTRSNTSAAGAGSHSPHNQHRITVTASCSEHSSNTNNSNNNSSATLTPSSGSSVAWTNTTHATPAAMTDPDMVAQAASSTSAPLKGTAVPTRTSSRMGQAAAESCSSSTSPLQKQRLSQSMRTQEEQDNDMDIISALEIADLKAAPYDFFSSSSANNSSSISNNNNNSGSNSSSSGSKSNAVELSFRHHMHSHHNHIHHGHGTTSCQHPSTSTNLDAAVAVPPVIGIGSRLEQDDEGQQTSRTLSGPDHRIRYMSDTTLDALDEEQQRKQRYQQQAQEELDLELDMGEEGMIKLEGGEDESDSILGVELGHLSPIPFSELPSMTSIGLCSRGIVRLSSNIKLLASATCVQICCNELGSIPMEIGFLRNLTLLDLSKNCLRSLPESITHLTKLVELKLSSNQLETIPAGIGGLTKLASLTLDNNNITSIPPQIGLIKELVNLDLSDNPIRVLPAEVGKLQFLRRLKLEGCPLVEEFVHSPVHSPPTLLELAARVIVRHDIQMPPLMLPHLKAYVDSAQSCTFCDGPYFDSWVKRGKLIEKNEMLIPLEYTLCLPHWNTEMERVRLLFCPRPVTSPRPKLANTPSPQGAQRNNSSTGNKKSDSATVQVRKQTIQSNSASTTASGSSKVPVLFSADSYFSTSSASAANSPAMSSSSPIMTSDSGNEQQQVVQRVRPTLGHRLSMLLRPKSERRERPLSAFMISTPSSASSSSASSPSLVSSPLMGGGEMTATPTRPSTMSRASTGLLSRAGFKGSRRPVSMVVGGSGSSPLANSSSPALLTHSTLSTSG